MTTPLTVRFWRTLIDMECTPQTAATFLSCSVAFARQEMARVQRMESDARVNAEVARQLRSTWRINGVKR